MYKIRNILPEDRRQIFKFLHQYEDISPEEIKIEMERIDKALFEKKQIKVIVLVHNETGHLTGFALYGSDPVARNTYHIYRIFTLPYQGKYNLKEVLLSMIEDDVDRSGGKLIVSEFPMDERFKDLQKLLIKNRFKKKAQLKDFYQEGIDQVIYGKPILTSQV